MGYVPASKFSYAFNHALWTMTVCGGDREASRCLCSRITAINSSLYTVALYGENHIGDSKKRPKRCWKEKLRLRKQTCRRSCRFKPWLVLLRLLISMMWLTVSQLPPISKRSLIRCMGVDGNVWWVQILAVSSLILQKLSSILLWRPSISLSSREPVLKYPPLYIFVEREKSERASERERERERESWGTHIMFWYSINHRQDQIYVRCFFV